MNVLRSIPGDVRSSSDAVRAHLELLLASDAFPASARRRRLLVHIVTETLDGRGGQLKAYDLAISVLGRETSFDGQVDPIVRIEIGRLRRDLDHFYAHQGRAEPFRIAIPKGRYQVEWEPQEKTAPTAPAEPLRAPEPLRLRQVGPTVPALPRLLVQPLRNLGGGEVGELLSVSLTEALYADLGAFESVEVFAGQGDGSRRDELWADGSGLAFVLGGIVESERDRVRVTVRLNDLRSGRMEWSNRFQRPLAAAGLLDVSAELSGTIAGRLASAYGAIHQAALRQLGDTLSPDDRWFTYASVQRVFAYRRAFARDAHFQVRANLDRAIQLQPDCAATQAMRAFTLMDAARYEIVEPGARGDELQAGLQAAEHAVAIAPDAALPLQALAALRYCNGEVDLAERLQRQALARCPSDTEALAQLAWRVGAQGRLHEGGAMLEQAIAGSPVVPSWYRQALAVILYLQGDLAAARAQARLATDYELGPGYVTLAVIEAEAGDRTVARAALGQALHRSDVLRRDPGAYWRAFQIVPELVERLAVATDRARR